MKEHHDEYERKRRVAVSIRISVGGGVSELMNGYVFLSTNQRLYDLLQTPNNFIIVSEVAINQHYDRRTHFVNKQFIIHAREDKGRTAAQSA